MECLLARLEGIVFKVKLSQDANRTPQIRIYFTTRALESELNLPLRSHNKFFVDLGFHELTKNIWMRLNI